MKIAVLSDVHSNLPALEVVLDSIKREGCEQAICLGDVVGYGAQPNECLEMLIKEDIPILLGNHDAVVIGKLSLDFLNIYAKQAAKWTIDVLSSEYKHHLNSYPLILEKSDYIFVHSSPYEPNQWNYIVSYEDARLAFRSFEKKICFFGHTHLPSIFANQSDGRRLINVGSVGQPRDNDPRACYSIFNTQTEDFKWIRLEYDINKAARLILSAGLPRFLAERLYLGI